MKEKAVVLDIDGIILDSSFILKEIHEKGLKGEEKWEYYYSNCNSDRVYVFDSAWELLQTFYDAEMQVLLSTARNERNRDATNQKLWFQHGICYDGLYMREEGDYRPSAEVKREHLQEIMKEYDIVMFVDDDLSNCEMAKEFGILSLRKV